MLAARTHNASVVEMLSGHKADVNASDVNKSTALMGAAQCYNAQMVKLLLANRADVNAANKNGDTPLEWAIMKDDTEIAEILILAGADYVVRVEGGRDFLGESSQKCSKLF